MTPRSERPQGFTLLELLVAMGIFLIICAVMFELLNMSQQRYNTETQVTAAYQDARLAMDQILRDINASGFPPLGMYSGASSPNPGSYANGPVAWSPNYPLVDCQIAFTCATPGPYDLILETRLGTDTHVSWIWYHLDPATSTLYRAVVDKVSGDPQSLVTSSGRAVALLTNTVNNPNSTLMGQIMAQNPTMFAGAKAVPVFQYSCVSPTPSSGPASLPCPLAGANNSPRLITDVSVTLIVMTPQPDLKTQRLRLVEMSGMGHSANPAK